jgi:hypothetical protein
VNYFSLAASREAVELAKQRGPVVSVGKERDYGLVQRGIVARDNLGAVRLGGDCFHPQRVCVDVHLRPCGALRVSDGVRGRGRGLFSASREDEHNEQEGLNVFHGMSLTLSARLANRKRPSLCISLSLTKKIEIPSYPSNEG